jgi:hypothetical protein
VSLEDFGNGPYLRASHLPGYAPKKVNCRSGRIRPFTEKANEDTSKPTMCTKTEQEDKRNPNPGAIPTIIG